MDLRWTTKNIGLSVAALAFGLPFPAPALTLPPSGFTTQDFHAKAQADCGAVDVRDSLGGEMKRFFSYPRIEGYFAQDHAQDDDVGLCFAMGSADVLSFQTGTPVSAMNLFLNYENRLDGFDHVWRFFYDLVSPDASPIADGGFANVALRQSLAASGYGMCQELAVPSNHRGDIDFDFPDAILGLQGAMRLAEQGDAGFRGAVRGTKLVRAFTGLAGSEGEAERRLEDLVWSGTQAGHSALQILTAASDQACVGRKIASNADPNAVVSFNHNDSDIFGPIDGQLDLVRRGRPRPNMPAIMYDTGFTRHSRSPNPTRRLFGSHVSPVIGRAWNKRRNLCEYRIRDSLFGTACAYYNEKNVRCVGDGTFWVSDAVLWDMTTFVTYIDQRPGGERR